MSEMIRRFINMTRGTLSAMALRALIDAVDALMPPSPFVAVYYAICRAADMVALYKSYGATEC